MCLPVSAHFDMFNMETCTIWPLCEILGSHRAVVENSSLQGNDACSGIDNQSVASHLHHHNSIFRTLVSLLVKLLSDLVMGNQNTAFCQKNEIQSKGTHNKF